MDEIARTPLYDLHVEAGARMVPFAGYAMPLQYAAGIMAEHSHTRERAGLFDVSHMGQVELRPRSGRVEEAAAALETLVPADIVGLKPGRQRYALLTDAAGGILDDLMIANLGDRLLLVVNASRKQEDLEHLRRGLGEGVEVSSHFDRGLLALQGPGAEAALAGLAPEAAQMRFMDVGEFEVDRVACTISRSGYTGEDGFELGMAGERAGAVARALLARPGVAWAGLGARDSLRLEAGLCLHGSDIDPETTPPEAGLEWAIPKVRRLGGARAGGFPGADVILPQLERGAQRRRVGLRSEGRAPLRGGAELYEGEEGGEPVGRVTSGGFGPSIGAPVAMAYVVKRLAETGTRLFAEVRGKRLPATVATLPFVAPGYKR